MFQVFTGVKTPVLDDDVVDAIYAGKTSVVRRCEIYEADGVTPWNPSVLTSVDGADLPPFEPMPVAGNVTVAGDSDVRRNFDLTLSNEDGLIIHSPDNGLWYDKIIKLFRGVRYTNNKTKPTVGMLGYTSSSGDTAYKYLSRLGITSWVPLTTQDALPANVDIVVAWGTGLDFNIATASYLAIAYASGRNVLSINNYATSASIPIMGTTVARTGNANWTLNPVAGDSPLQGWFKNAFTEPGYTGEKIPTAMAAGTIALATDTYSAAPCYPVMYQTNNAGGRWIHIQPKLADVGSNQLTNPSGETNITGWNGQGTSALTRDNTVAHAGSWSGKAVFNAVSNPNVNYKQVSTAQPCNPGDLVKWGVWVYPTVACVYTPITYWYNSGGTQISNTSSATVSCPANQWTFVSNGSGLTAPALTVGSAFAGQYNGTPIAGTIVYYDDWSMSVGQSQQASYAALMTLLRGIATFLYEYAADRLWEIQIGEFMIDSIVEPNFPKQITISGRDYTKKLDNFKFKKTTTWVNSTAIEVVMRGIAAQAGITKFRLANVANLSSDFTVARESSALEAFTTLSEAYNIEFYFDNAGYLVTRAFLDPLTSPTSVTLQTGTTDPDRANLVSFTKTSTDSDMKNSVMVIGTKNDADVWIATAVNDDPDSPTSTVRVGERTTFYTSVSFASKDAGQAYANRLLAASGMETFSIDFSSLVLPWLEANEIVLFIDPNDAYFPRRHLLTGFQIPLGLEPMTGTGKRIALVGATV